jgi:MATE family multidrug resistance protein
VSRHTTSLLSEDLARSRDRNPENQTWIILQLAIPVVLSQVSHTLVGLADTIMVGQTGNVTALAASALANNIFSLAIVFALGISYVLTPKISEYFAQREIQTCKNLLVNSLLNNMIWAVVVSLILGLLLPFSVFLEQPEKVLDQALPFFKLQIWSLPGIMLFQTFRQFYDGLGNTKPGMVVSIGANLLNVCMNYLLIFGSWGCPELGLYGAGISNLIARWVMGLGMAGYFYLSASGFEWRDSFQLSNISFRSFRLLNKLGLPVAFQFLFEVGAFSFTALLVGRMGESALASHQIVITLASVTYMMASGLSSASSIRVGHFFGLKYKKMILLSGIRSFQMVSVFMFCTAILFLFFRNDIPLMFIQNQTVADTGAELLIIAGFFQLSDGIQVIGLGCLRGLSDVMIPTIITMFAYWVVAIPFGYYLGLTLHMGPAGTWWALCAGLSVSAIFMLIRFLSLSKSLVFPDNDTPD